MITGGYLLFVSYISLLAGMKVQMEQHAEPLIDPERLQELIPKSSALNTKHGDHEMCNATNSTRNTPQVQISTQTGLRSRPSREKNESLAELLLAIVDAELSQCVLGVVWDSGFSNSVIVDSLSLLPNIKQVIMMYNT